MWYGMYLQSFRKRNELTRNDIAARTGISPSTIAKIEAGIVIPSIEQFIRLANAFRVPLPQLLIEVGVIRQKDMALALPDRHTRKSTHPKKKTRTGHRSIEQPYLRAAHDR
jgi:transcriptional regulator with XRE-family HTH domain